MPAHNVRFASRLHSDSADIRNPMQSFDEGAGWRGAPGVMFGFRNVRGNAAGAGFEKFPLVGAKATQRRCSPDHRKIMLECWRATRQASGGGTECWGEILDSAASDRVHRRARRWICRLGRLGVRVGTIADALRRYRGEPLGGLRRNLGTRRRSDPVRQCGCRHDVRKRNTPKWRRPEEQVRRPSDLYDDCRLPGCGWSVWHGLPR
jgi:hypothetical protein